MRAQVKFHKNNRKEIFFLDLLCGLHYNDMRSRVRDRCVRFSQSVVALSASVHVSILEFHV